MNLAETQLALRKMILSFFLIVMSYYLGKYLLIQGRNTYNKLKPPEPAPVEAKFGKLPRLTMKSIKIEGHPKYVLDTNTGKFPKFPDRLNVYRIVQPQPNLLSEQRIKKLAIDLGFNKGFTKTSTSEFRWVDGKNNRILEANVVTKEFNLVTPLEKIGAVLSQASTITEADAKEKASSFIKSKGVISPPDLDNLSFTTVPSQIVLGQLKDSKLFAEQTKIIKVDGYINVVKRATDPKGKQKTISSYKMLGPDPKTSLINIYITNNNGAFKFPLINFKYWQPDYNNGSDYFLSSIKDVWKTIQAENGIITYLKSSSNDYYEKTTNTNLKLIEIRNVYIAYYEQKNLTSYLQPIYVFEGQYTATTLKGTSETGEIVLYYPAVRGDFVK